MFYFIAHYAPKIIKKEAFLLKSWVVALSTVVLILVLDEEVLAGRLLVLVADEVGDGLVLRLFGSAFVALVTLTQDVLLDVVDSY